MTTNVTIRTFQHEAAVELFDDDGNTISDILVEAQSEKHFVVFKNQSIQVVEV